MSTYLHRKILKILMDSGVSFYNNKILLALSGGKDSLCLLKIVQDLGLIYQWQIGIIHCNHDWRSDSIENAQMIYNLAMELNLDFYLAKNNRQLISESNARQWRYYNFFTVASHDNYNIIFTAHNLNDKVETILYNLFRGSGTNGTLSLVDSKFITSLILLQRPLLSVNLNETFWFARYYCLPIWADITNMNLKYKRNRLRHDIIPYIKNYFNPQLNKHIIQFSDKLFIQVNSYYQLSYQVYLKIIHPKYLAIHIYHYSNLHDIMQITIVKILLKQLNISSFLDTTIKKIVIFLKNINYSNYILYLQDVVIIKKDIYIYFAQSK
uniref:tRNA(Ile)-lysidine synthase n=1 Tax=Stylonema alsidii TaxID=35155 RepID=UPI001FCD57D5|nr:tRNA(Ile)-lysidine synthase [Stylonema alsidii]UNJ15219.1 tRNA(Ile)-lysidine synthase [Stylonema alsidii]